TPAAGLSYNIRVGRMPGGSDVVSAPALATGKLLIPQMGAARKGSATLHLAPGHYYWSVQAVDSSFAGSPFATEQQFSTGQPLINPIRHPDGVIELNFTSRQGATFNVLAAANLTTNPAGWAVLGAAIEISPGQFRFADAQATNHPSRFYRVRSL